VKTTKATPKNDAMRAAREGRVKKAEAAKALREAIRAGKIKSIRIGPSTATGQ
jgi:hypothetical protein